ncbi:hypothetical protein SeLEV6574_g07599 [Synchytrium endobioticum]|uniref:Ubiquinone biosynthesis O-methyltransferase, mitochondrial n=1 Tax=Synchytrium endobioticum TaxID=286115 RepID=A0A507CL99_9FUNG|nr:hypothetical protein SeLEV6574_g07599 [Synchytrium endobioticum]
MNRLASRLRPPARIAPSPRRNHAPSASDSDSNCKTSVNQDEILRFRNVSAHWWNPHGPYRLLHKMNPVRTAYIKTHTSELLPSQYVPTPAASAVSTARKRPLEGYTMLDLGCGGGLLSEGLARLGGNVVGIDADETAVHVAKEHAKTDPLVSHNTNYINTTAEQLAETHESNFDVVCALEIIEHVSDRNVFLQSCAKLLKPNGLLFISTINRTPVSYFLTILMAEHVLNLVPKNTHTHNQYVTPQELESELSNVGCRLRDVSGLIFNPLGGHWKVVEAGGISGRGTALGGFMNKAALQANYITCAVKSC